MSAPAQPVIDSLEAALTKLQGELASITAENAALKKQIDAGVLTDDQATKITSLTDAVNSLGKL
jgi:cell division protein FtsB